MTYQKINTKNILVNNKEKKKEDKMSWRIQQNHKEETKTVKDALAMAGINAKVNHGRGTAWGWLEINLGPDKLIHWKVGKNNEVLEITQEEASHFPFYAPCVGNCSACEKNRQLVNKTISIAQSVTGRHGDYDGKINILQQ